MGRLELSVLGHGPAFAPAWNSRPPESLLMQDPSCMNCRTSKISCGQSILGAAYNAASPSFGSACVLLPLFYDVVYDSWVHGILGYTFSRESFAGARPNEILEYCGLSVTLGEGECSFNIVNGSLLEKRKVALDLLDDIRWPSALQSRSSTSRISDREGNTATSKQQRLEDNTSPTSLLRRHTVEYD